MPGRYFHQMRVDSCGVRMGIPEDRKSFIKQDKGWTWPFTPTPVQAEQALRNRPGK